MNYDEIYKTYDEKVEFLSRILLLGKAFERKQCVKPLRKILNDKSLSDSEKAHAIMEILNSLD